MQTKLKQFIRDSRKRLVGVMTARKVTDDTVVIGISKCHMGKDKFDKALGEKIADGRIDVAVYESMGTEFAVPVNDIDQMKIAATDMAQVRNFADRTAKFFRVKNVAVAPGSSAKMV